MRSETECICGKKAKFRVGTVIHKPLEKEIKVHNVPHFKCDYCDSIWYNSEIKISEVVVKAYKDGLSQIDYNSHKISTQK